jgi:hypothetical protein
MKLLVFDMGCTPLNVATHQTSEWEHQIEGGLVKRAFLLFLLCLALGIGNAWAGVTGSTNSSQFSDLVDWCVQYGCTNNSAPFTTPQSWTSAGGNTGTVGLVGGQSFYNLQEGVTWGGQFTNGMGLIYNGRLFGNSDADIAVTFNQGLYGAGAYIQSDYYGPFTATIELFDSSDALLGSFTTTGTSGYGPGTALFIGGYTFAPDVYGAEFNVVDQYGIDDVAIGTMGLQTTMVTPEPVTMVLFSSFLGLAGLARRRK